MRIALVASEVAPFAKTGGLADVAGALPKELAALRHDVCVFMPLFRHVKKSGQKVTDTGKTVVVPIAERSVTGRIYKGAVPDSAVPVYFIGNDEYYDRDELYLDRARNDDYADNCERFVFFSRAVLEAIEALGLRPDVIHCNDWQTGLIPVYLKTIYANRALGKARTLFTVHNLAYQGLFWHWDMKLTGLDWSLFNWRQLEFYGKLNCLKAGLIFADVLNTVSRRYAKEIQTPEFGCGLEGVLADRAKDLYGVINGIDYSVWNPETDALIPARFSAADPAGKQACKEALLASQKLPMKKNVPLIGMISRLASQKGFDILEIALDEIMELKLQIVLLGTGDKKYHTLFEAAAKKHPDKLAVNLTFNNKLAHEIEAGCDMFLMPSHYEPCGLNQLYSLKYGTIPVVRATGGLADTIVDCRPGTLGNGTATGFTFEKYGPVELLETIERAVRLYNSRKDWLQLVKNAMSQDWSWTRSAKEYVDLYKQAMSR